MKPTRSSGKSRLKCAGSASQAGSDRPDAKSFPIVGIGASAGGLEAFTQLLGRLPRKTGMAFVLVQHLAPRHESALTELLSRTTSIPVTEVKDGMAVQPDCVYVIPPNVNMGVLEGRLHLLPRTLTQKHLPIDFFLRSLAEERGAAAIGVILSGTASDGSMGMKAIKAEGGITFAQDENSAKYGDMPRNAIATGCVDFVLPPEAIAEELLRIARHPYLRQPPAAELGDLSGEGDDGLRKVFVLLRAASGVDFTHYKHSTIKRRIKRRMVLHKTQSLKDYITLLQENRAELDALYQDILIHVTGFFRDPEVFETLKAKIFPRLLENRPAGLPLRIWVPGCSTGEEPYSLAISLLEFLGDSSDSVDIQVFATDISEAALERARAGAYLENISSDVSPERLRRFFVRSVHGYQINKAIRDLCVFARQDIIKDPPFSRLDLISCRNVLIYLGSLLQKKVIPIFHYALRSTGYLLLGNSETIGGFGDHFSLVDKKHKIYSKKSLPSRLALEFPREDYELSRGPALKKIREAGSPFDIQTETDRILLEKFAPAGVVVNDDLAILHFHGQTGAYLEPAPGQASLTLPKMAREGLLVDVRAAIQKAKKEGKPVKKPGIQIRSDGRTLDVDVEVVPLKGPPSGEPCFLVLFEEVPPPKPELPKSSKREARQRLQDHAAHEHQIRQMKDELAETKRNLQSIIEEQETTNEELKSANEEILSSNEEMQSTNEELETAKEELQSTNEELTTLNEELQNRNLELGIANSDLLNLLASVNVPILMLGNDLRIRHFTAAAEKLLNLIPTDVGRPISDLKPNLAINNLAQTITEAIDHLSAKESELQDSQGHWYSMRIRPYITSENKIDGVVLTWFDITSLKVMQEGTAKALGEVEGRYRALFERNLAGIFRVTASGRFLECNSAFARIFRYESPAEVVTHTAAELFCSGDGMDSIMARLLAAGGPVNFQLRLCRKDGAAAWMLMNAALVEAAGAPEPEIEGIVLDITEHRQAQESLRHLTTQLTGLQDSERKRISRELHDVTGSSLTALIANLAWVKKAGAKLDVKARKALNEGLKLARQCSQEIRTVSYLLHAPLLDEMGLGSALRGYVDGFGERSQVRVDLELPPDLGRLPQDMEAAIFHIVQESLSNIHRHSGSSTANIRMTHVDNEIKLEIVDQGKGIAQPSSHAAHEPPGKVRAGVGIPGMRERVRQLGGQFEVESGSQGTTVRAVFPLPAVGGTGK